MQTQIGLVEVNRWLSHPVSEHYFKLIDELENKYKELLTSGALLNRDNPVKEYALVFGFLDALKTIKDVENFAVDWRDRYETKTDAV